jgi:hypothetical protein
VAAGLGIRGSGAVVNLPMRVLRLMAMLALLFGGSNALAREGREQARIEALIESVKNLKGAVFIRNGGDHNAAAAADHLRLKLKRAGERIKTAEHFIEYCASRSSFTGDKYRIRLAVGRVIEAQAFFKEQLKQIDAKTAGPR